MRIKSTWGTFLFVIIAVTIVVCGNLFLINVGLKGKVDAPFKITADKNPTESNYYPGCYIDHFGGTVTGMYYFSKSGEKIATDYMFINEAHLGGFDYTVGNGETVSEVYINIKDGTGEKCFAAEEKTWPAIEFFYEGASDTVKTGNKVLIAFVEYQGSNRIVSISDNRTREQEIALVKKDINDTVLTIIMSLIVLDLAAVLFFFNLYRLIDAVQSGEKGTQEVTVLIVLTVVLGVSICSLSVRKAVSYRTKQYAIETTQKLGLHDGE